MLLVVHTVSRILRSACGTSFSVVSPCAAPSVDTANSAASDKHRRRRLVPPSLMNPSPRVAGPRGPHGSQMRGSASPSEPRPSAAATGDARPKLVQDTAEEGAADGKDDVVGGLGQKV